jgi:SPP1 gp7 family putative phage head morphogenesis protein
MAVPSFAEALAYAKARQVVLPQDFYDPANIDQHGQLMTVSHLAGLSQIQAVTDDLMKALENGETFDQWQQRVLSVEDVPGLPPGRTETIFRNFMQTAYNGGRWAQFERNKATSPYLMYSAINDARTTDICRNRNGIIRPVDDAFWSTNSPPAHHNCFLPGVKVRGDFEIGLKSWYAGPAVEIITDSGFQLSATVNHPILTRQGWIGAGSIQEGDDLLCNCAGDNAAIIGVVDNQNPPARVEDVFKTLARDAFGVIQITAFDFQSDTQFRKGDVYVSGSKCVLMNGFKPAIHQGIQDGYFVRTTAFVSVALASVCRSFFRVVNFVFHQNTNDIGTAGIEPSGKCVAAFLRVLIGVKNGFLKRIITMRSGFPCFFALPFSASRRLFDFSPFHQFGFASSTNHDAISFEKPLNSRHTDVGFFSNLFGAISRHIARNGLFRVFRRPLPDRHWPVSPKFKGFSIGHSLNPMITQQPIKETVANSELFESLSHRSAGLILPDKVKCVRYFTFSGHVYDFQTANGLILADGIITHNCRSTLIALTAGQAQARSPGDKGLNQPEPKEPMADGWGYKPVATAAGQGDALANVLADHLKDYPKSMWSQITDIFIGAWGLLGKLLKAILP